MTAMVFPRIIHYSAADGYRCAVRVWKPERPLARVVILHGIISHGGWYWQSCDYLAARGIEVHLIDRRGSGLNASGLGDVDIYRTWLSDVELYLEQLGEEVPRLLLGISWGGKLAVAVARHRAELVRGVGLLCPGLFARQSPAGWQHMALRIAASLGQLDRRLKIPLQDPELFTNSPYWRQFIRRDPLTLRQVTIRFALADQQLTRYATEATVDFLVPSLLMLSGRDRIVDNGRVRKFFQRSGAVDRQLIEYTNAAHTLEFEWDPVPYFEDLRRWVEAVARG